MISVLQPSFTGGELAPGLYGRVDLAVYSTSLALCKNFIAQAYGGAKNRPGSRFVAAAKAGQTIARLIPFVYNAEQSYVLEIGAIAGGDQYMRVYSRGRQVVYQDNVPAGKSAGDPVELLNLPWLPADIASLKYTQSADVLTVCHPSYPPMQILRYAEDMWGIKEFEYVNGPFGAVNTDKSVFVYADSPTGVVTLTASTAMFKPEHSGRFFYIEVKDFGKPWETNIAVNSGEIRRADGKYYVALNSGTTGTLRPTHTEGRWWDGSKGDAVEWEFLHAGFGIVKLGDIASTSSTCEGTVISRIPDSISSGIAGGSVVLNVTDMYDNGGQLGLDLDDTGVLPTATFECTLNLNFYNGSSGLVTFSRVVLASVTSPSTVLAEVLWSEIVDLGFDSYKDGTLHYRSTEGSTDTYKWAFGAWGDAPGYPSCTTYFQQRQFFAGSPGYPQTVWGSRTNAYVDFGTSNPILDTDAISYTLASSQIDRVRALLALDKLVMFTQGGNWVTGSGQEDVITPANLSAKVQNYYGSSNLAPLAVGNTVLYYGKGGTVRDMSYEFASDSYTGNDLTIRASHLFENKTIVDWAFQNSPFPIVWAVRDDGVLLGATYLREQSVTGWHQHEFSGSVESVAVINECNQDHVYLLIKRTINGSTYRSIEYMSNRIDDLYEQFFVDGGITYDGRNVYGGTVKATGGTTWASGDTVTITYTPNSYQSTLFVTGAPSTDIGDQIVLEAADGTRHRITITAVTSTTVATGTLTSTLPVDLRATSTDSWAFARDTITVLSHLEGKTVSVYSDGAYIGTKTVSSGAISLTGSPGYVIHAGLPITAYLKTLRVAVPGQMGPALEQKKLVTQVRFMLENSRSFYVGPDENHLYKCTIGSNDYEASGGVQTGIAVVSSVAGWQRDGQVLVKHTEPTALSILAIIPDVTFPAAARQS
jgi:hypothetical protein